MIGAMNVKLVPWMLSSPEPIGPIRRVCSTVASPKTNSDMLTRYAVCAASSFSAPAISRGGVTMPTNTANTC